MEPTIFAFAYRTEPDEDGRLVVSFRDFPEALTDGADEDEAHREAADCLTTVIGGRLAEGVEIPPPSKPQRGERQVAPGETVAYKAALHAALAKRELTVAQLARRLDVTHKETRRILDPYYPTKINSLRTAIEALGVSAAPTFYDPSRRERLLMSPAEARAGTRRAARIDKTVEARPVKKPVRETS